MEEEKDINNVKDEEVSEVNELRNVSEQVNEEESRDRNVAVSVNEESRVQNVSVSASEDNRVSNLRESVNEEIEAEPTTLGAGAKGCAAAKPKRGCRPCKNGETPLRLRDKTNCPDCGKQVFMP